MSHIHVSKTDPFPQPALDLPQPQISFLLCHIKRRLSNIFLAVKSSLQIVVDKSQDSSFANGRITFDYTKKINLIRRLTQVALRKEKSKYPDKQIYHIFKNRIQNYIDLTKDTLARGLFVDIKKKLSVGGHSYIHFAMNTECRFLAIKMNKFALDFFYCLQRELTIIERMKQANIQRITDVKDSFYIGPSYNALLAVVMDHLGCSLYEVLFRSYPSGMPLDCIRIIGNNILRTLKEMNDIGLMHCDIKTNNIMMKGEDIYLVDFGLACELREQIGKSIQSIEYRSLEVALEIFDLVTSKIDVWGLACVLMELYQGPCNFFNNGVSSNEILIGILSEFLQQKIPDDLIELSPKKDVFFHKDEDNHWVLKNQHPLLSVGRKVNFMKKYMRVVDVEPDSGTVKITAKEHCDFFDFIQMALCFDPRRRISVEDALEHPFFSN